MSSLTSILFYFLAAAMKTVVQAFLACLVGVEHKTLFYTVFQKGSICMNEFGFIFGAQLVWNISKLGLYVDSRQKGGWFFCPQSHYWQTDWIKLRHIAATTQAGWIGISVILWGNCDHKRRCLTTLQEGFPQRWTFFVLLCESRNSITTSRLWR